MYHIALKLNSAARYSHKGQKPGLESRPLSLSCCGVSALYKVCMNSIGYSCPGNSSRELEVQTTQVHGRHGQVYFWPDGKSLSMSGMFTLYCRESSIQDKQKEYLIWTTPVLSGQVHCGMVTHCLHAGL